MHNHSDKPRGCCFKFLTIAAYFFIPLGQKRAPLTPFKPLVLCDKYSISVISDTVPIEQAMRLS